MSSQPIAVLPSVSAAYRLLVANWQRFVLAGLPFTLAYAIKLWLGQMAQSAELTGFWLTLDAVALIALTVGSLAFSAMTFRLAVRDEYDGQWGLRLSADEWRLFVVAMLNAALVLIVALLAAMFAIVVFGTVAAGAVERAGIDAEATGIDLPMAMQYLTTADWTAVWVVNGLALLLVGWLVARLCLSFPASFAQRSVRVLSVWSLSEGQAWRILTTMLVALAPLVAVEIALYELVSALLGDRLLMVPVALGDDLLTAGGFVRIPEYLRLTGLFAIVNLPVVAGLYAHFHTLRVPDNA
ncbi:hypothetical protein [Maricaulis sp.]|uniref:hypothetical protein n=1 Tax=Maricaulis sp. TaxID=1486257 RepID=UPI002B27485C|nr:hypothetical protein [Maricaulis sp.]